MAAMRITVDAAMRARDVSRPQQEDAARAAVADAEPSQASQGTASRNGAPRSTGPGDAAVSSGNRSVTAARGGTRPPVPAPAGTGNPADTGNPANTATPANSGAGIPPPFPGSRRRGRRRPRR